MAKVLIKGGTVLSLDRAVGNLVEADVLIDDGIISEVGSSLRARSAEVVDAADTIVMPGFVDAHRHLWQSLIGDIDSASDDRDLPGTTHLTTSTPPRSSDCSERSRRASPPSSTGAIFPMTPLASMLR